MNNQILKLLLITLLFTTSILAQIDKQIQKDSKTAIISTPKELDENASPAEWANAALMAHGGKNLVEMKTLIISGAIEATPPNFPQVMSGSFALIQSENKGRLQVDLGIFKFVQVYDGVNLDSTLKQVKLPPLTKYGISVLSKIEDPKYKISYTKDKKPFSFILTSPDGVMTEFILNPKNGEVKNCNSTFVSDGTKMDTALEYVEFERVEGILLPKVFHQRLDFGQDSAYIKYKAKTIQVNKEVDADVFTLKNNGK